MGVLADGCPPNDARCYLTDDALADLARAVVVTLADGSFVADVLEWACIAARVRCRSSVGVWRAPGGHSGLVREVDDSIDRLRTTVV